jgi:hypothetical protein
MPPLIESTVQSPALKDCSEAGSAGDNSAIEEAHAVAHCVPPRLSCQVQSGIPVVRGATPSYYIFNQKGERLLILSRKQNEGIGIDNAIDIVILEIGSDEVKLGIVCPDDASPNCDSAHHVECQAKLGVRPR